jgi:hypothetical protein
MRAERRQPWSAAIFARGRAARTRLQAFEIETIVAPADNTWARQAAIKKARLQPKVDLRREALKSF